LPARNRRNTFGKRGGKEGRREGGREGAGGGWRETQIDTLERGRMKETNQVERRTRKTEERRRELFTCLHSYVGTLQFLLWCVVAIMLLLVLLVLVGLIFSSFFFFSCCRPHDLHSAFD